MNIVKFKDGKFGIRRGNWWTGYMFKDLKKHSNTVNTFWWNLESRFFDDCKEEEEIVRKFFQGKQDYGEVIK